VHIVDPLKVHDTTQLHDLGLISPWSPIGVAKSETPGIAALIGAWSSGHRLSNLVVLPANSAIAPHSALHATLRKAGPPSAEEVAEWILLRTSSQRLATAVLAELTQGSSPGRQARHTRFAKSGPLLASGWKNAFRLAQALTYPCDSTIDSIAGGIERDVRTLRSLTQKLLGMTITLARTGFGWRWAIEHILQRHGYLDDIEPVTLAVGQPSGRDMEQTYWISRNLTALRAGMA
jgi:hypothetical protein